MKLSDMHDFNVDRTALQELLERRRKLKRGGEALIFVGGYSIVTVHPSKGDPLYDDAHDHPTWMAGLKASEARQAPEPPDHETLIAIASRRIDREIEILVAGIKARYGVEIEVD